MKLPLELVLDKTLWVAKMNGWRAVGTYKELEELSKSEECRDFDICANQPDELKDFYRQYFKFDEECGFITVQDFYKYHYKG